ncbi:dihydrofolate reductase family protein [Nonomuraea jabiensis]|uniref:dihydrofolate reductase family protein n=1 Tax=Nonomuraea jabiensis TaxID=882448 RepID=UPI003433E861
MVSPRATLAISAALAFIAALVLRWGLSARPARASGRPSVAATWQVNRHLLSTPARRAVYLATWVPNGPVVGCEALFVPYAPHSAAALFVVRPVPLGRLPAATVTRDPAATVRELKQQGGKDIWLWGSLTLMNSLLEAGLLDEVTLLVCPVSRGKGRRVFEDRQDLKLIEATSFDNGLAVLRYEITK